MIKGLREISLFVKRLIDIQVSMILLFFLSPLFIIVAILIKVLMPGPVFFYQERVGKRERIFSIIKFRTMKTEQSAEKNFDFSRDKDRLTALGSFLRRFKIDELPQFINVLRGDMSIIGPRPTIKIQTDNYTVDQKKRLDMKPGITGLAQVCGNTALSWEERICLDVRYIERFSLLMDAKILIKTIFVVVFGESRFIKKA